MISPASFEDLVGEALDEVPPGLMALLDNVVFLVEDEPDPDDPDLLGLYEGVPLTERDAGWGQGRYRTGSCCFAVRCPGCARTSTSFATR